MNLYNRFNNLNKDNLVARLLFWCISIGCRIGLRDRFRASCLMMVVLLLLLLIFCFEYNRLVWSGAWKTIRERNHKDHSCFIRILPPRLMHFVSRYSNNVTTTCTEGDIPLAAIRISESKERKMMVFSVSSLVEWMTLLRMPKEQLLNREIFFCDLSDSSLIRKTQHRKIMIQPIQLN